MNIPMSFFNPDDECENLITHAHALYHRAARGAPVAPSAEDIFPQLMAFAASNGLIEPMAFSPNTTAFREAQLGKITAALKLCFKTAPHMAAQLIAADTAVQPQQPEVGSSLPVAKVMPLQQNLSPVQIDSQIVTVLDREDAAIKNTAPKRVSAYRVEQALIRKEVIRIVGEALYVFTGVHYSHISAECLRRLIMRDCRDAVEEVGSSKLIEEVFRLLLCDPDLFTQEEELDEHLLAFDNGVLDLRTGSLFPPAPAFNLFYKLNAPWVEHSYHPVFDSFLRSISGGDVLLEQRLLEVIGYCLTADTYGKCCFVFQGVPNSGKSILAKFIRGCINTDATVALDITALGERFALANLVGKQLCLSMDLPAAPLNAKVVGTFKSITGGDLITADVKYNPHITFYNRARYILGTNHPLLTQERDDAFFERVIAVPFRYGVPRGQQNTHLLAELEAERPAIIHDAILAYQGLKQRNYVFSGSFRINEMFQSEEKVAALSPDDAVLNFVQTCCSPDDAAAVFIADLYAEFCRQNPSLPLSSTQIGNKVLDACARLGWNNVHRGQKVRRDKNSSPQANLVGLKFKERI